MYNNAFCETISFFVSVMDDGCSCAVFAQLSIDEDRIVPTESVAVIRADSLLRTVRERSSGNQRLQRERDGVPAGAPEIYRIIFLPSNARRAECSSGEMK